MNKRKFTWLDGVVIGVLVLAVAVVGVWYFNRGGDAPAAELKDYRITLQAVQLADEVGECYAEGETLYFQNRVGVLGTIETVDREARNKEVEKFNATTGEFVVYEDPNQKLIRMTVLAQGTMENGVITVGGEELNIGKTLYPQTDRARSTMLIWDIEEVAK
ncbi:MAG: DUF4330 family protein [Clostridia bacterium]|nr:DUF4330 family protein [Clostridia bacterium]